MRREQVRAVGWWAQAVLDEVEANPLWAQLPAVRSGDVVVFDRLAYPGATGQIRFLHDLTTAIAGQPQG